ncbi:DUF6763 family protein [Polycyclovorans algicola]|uniref:DUF6763 family protein n=1 Tax=Polycyclovorans algicola TaxID=616992 RepID=UPI0004A77EDE|nr:DUF6763 family protein [Polycyclovorans algicola]
MAQWLSEMSVGQWFQTPQQSFEIVGLDPEHELVLVQHYDGTLEEYDFDSWLELAAVPREAPEDLDGAFDTERDDFGLEDDRPWTDPLREPLSHLDDFGL